MTNWSNSTNVFGHLNEMEKKIKDLAREGINLGSKSTLKLRFKDIFDVSLDNDFLSFEICATGTYIRL